jgi:hypothetical protein
MGKPVSCLSAVLLFIVTPAFAAEIEAAPAGNGDLSFIFFTGEIVKSDWQRFSEVSENIPHAVVIFMKSPGGDLETALDIGALIRQRSYSTSAPDLCASACGLAWLAGFRRYMYPSSQIGFHAAYRGAGVESGVGNALVGAYLTDLKLSLRVIRYITTPAPNTVQWLSIRDAMVLGISIETPPLEKKQ